MKPWKYDWIFGAAIVFLILAAVAFGGVTTITEPKHPFEALPATVDFSKRLPSGDNVASCTVLGYDQGGNIVTDNIVAVDNSYLDNASRGQVISYTYKGGDDGGTYKIKFRCTSDNGFKVEQDVVFTVREY